MPTLEISATELKYASASSWTNGEARQDDNGVARYQGAIRFGGINGSTFDNMAVSRIDLVMTFGKNGGASEKRMFFYRSNGNEITGAIATLRGNPLYGAIGTDYFIVPDAYNGTRTVTLDAGNRPNLFNALLAYLRAGNQTLIIWRPSPSRGTYSGGYAYDYLAVTAMTLRVEYTFLKSTASLSPANVTTGNRSTVNITMHNSAYSHTVEWAIGSKYQKNDLGAGVTSTYFDIPHHWAEAIPNSATGTVTVTLTTRNGGAVIGSEAYSFTLTADSSLIPDFTLAHEGSSSNSVVNGWGKSVYVQSRSIVTALLSNVAGIHGSSIVSRAISITAAATGQVLASGSSPSIAQLVSAAIHVSGTNAVRVSATVTDSRGRSRTRAADIRYWRIARRRSRRWKRTDRTAPACRTRTTAHSRA